MAKVPSQFSSLKTILFMSTIQPLKTVIGTNNSIFFRTNFRNVKILTLHFRVKIRHYDGTFRTFLPWRCHKMWWLKKKPQLTQGIQKTSGHRWGDMFLGYLRFVVTTQSSEHAYLRFFRHCWTSEFFFLWPKNEAYFDMRNPRKNTPPWEIR